MPCTKDTVKKAGLNIWANGDRSNSGPEVDIIAVQGLGSHPYHTWAKKPDLASSGHLSLSKVLRNRRQEPSNAIFQTTSNRSEVMWLQDLLPNLIPNARIASYSYESDWRHDVKTNLRKCGEQFLNVLHQNRVGNMERKRPLIIIGHSLGGLVIKQALVLANHGDIFKDIKLAIVGVLFLGTPHQGSSAAEYGMWLARALGNDTSLLEILKRNSPTLLEIAQDFEASYNKVDIVCFYEKKDGPLGIQFVDHQSASLNGKRRIYLNTDHSGLNKYLNFNDENFLLVQAEISRMAQVAPQIIEERYSCMTLNSQAQEVFPWCSNNLQANKIVKVENSFYITFSLRGIPVMDKFVGRDTELTRLAQLLVSSTPKNMRRKVCLLHGIGGVGKSQLAAEFARKHQEIFSAIFWIDGSTKEKLRGNIVALAHRLPPHQIPERARSLSKDTAKDLDAIAKDILKWFSLPSNNKWLLIFDNVDREYSAREKDSEAFNIKEYWPEADQGSILITSRLASMWRLAGSDIKLEPFDALEGEHLLNLIVQKPLVGSLELVELLQGLPLAIDQAGSYMRETGTNALQYMEYYEETWGELMTQQHHFALEEATAPSILTTWTISFNDLEEKCQEAANLLILWAFLDNQDIWYELFTPALGLTELLPLPDWFVQCIGHEFEFKKCTRFLIKYSFVTANIESLSFSIHSVLHCWCFYSSDKVKIEMAWLASMVVASASPTKSDTDHTLLQRRLLPHCNRIYSLLHHNIPQKLDEISGLALMIAYHSLAMLYSDQGKMVEAEAMYLRALAGKEKAWGPDSTSTLETVNDLGILYAEQGKMAEAEAMFLRALAGKEKAWGPDRTSTLDTVNNLGILYKHQGKMAGAEAMYRRALVGRENDWGPDHTSTLDTLNNLGNLYKDQGKMAEAEAMFLRALAGKEKAWGPDHTSTLDTVNNLGLLYSDQGKIGEAEAMILRALTGKENAWGPDHTSTLNTVNNLGILYFNQGKTTEAEAMFLRALAGKEKAWGRDHTSTLMTVNNLGLLYSDGGKKAEAEAMFLRTLAGFEKALGLDHTSTIDTLNSLGILYKDQGKMAEAEAMFLRALAEYEKARGPEHQCTLDTRYELAGLLEAKLMLQDAAKHFGLVVQGYTKLYGPEHPKTMNASDRLKCYEDSGNGTGDFDGDYDDGEKWQS